jgi:hypothetical protein
MGWIRMNGASCGMLSAALLFSLGADAQTSAGHVEPPERDRYVFVVHGETHIELFHRAVAPWREGALVETEALLPLSEYVSLYVADLDTGLGEDTLDLELAAYGQVVPGSAGGERRVDGDVQTASVRYHQHGLSLELGRQLVAGGAARYARFDGLRAEAELGSGFHAGAYGGLGVLPRWDARPSYRYLGSIPTSDLADPELARDLRRMDHLLFGGRAGWWSDEGALGLSFHESRERGGLSHRNLGLDGRVVLSPETSGHGTALFDLDSRRAADLRMSIDFAPIRELDLVVALSHSEPALLLSRQSVLAVFSTTSYDEALFLVALKPGGPIVLEGDAAVQSYPEGRPGARAGASARGWRPAFGGRHRRR